jgi:hypothetical protein
MVTSRSVLSSFVAATFALVALGCGSSSDEPAAGTASTTSPSTIPATTAAPASTLEPPEPTSAETTAPATAPNVAFQVFWTRGFGDARPVDVPGYRDDPDKPHPYVLYGSAANQGDTPIDTPRVQVRWLQEGQSIHETVVALREPTGGPSPTLEPGATADLIVVVDDEAVAAQLSDADATFAMAA